MDWIERRRSLREVAPLQAVRRFVGGFYLTMGGVNAGIVFADPTTYAHFADQSALPFVVRTWSEVVMSAPAFWGLLLAVGEIVLGVLLLRGGRGARFGWAGVLVFHALLMLFGPGIWVWCLPVLAVLSPLAWAEWPVLDREDEARSARKQPLRIGRGRE